MKTQKNTKNTEKCSEKIPSLFHPSLFTEQNQIYTDIMSENFLEDFLLIQKDELYLEEQKNRNL